MSTSPAARLGDAVRARRKELGDISQMDVWLAGGPSNTTLTRIENGQLPSLTRTTARKLDIGMQWEPGTAKRIYDGSADAGLGVEPTKVDDVRQVIQTADLPDDVRRDLLERLDRDARPAPPRPPVKPRATGTEGR